VTASRARPAGTIPAGPPAPQEAISGTFPLDQWRTALEISLTGRARGKLLLLPAADARE
jgi:hypothetical protein